MSIVRIEFLIYFTVSPKHDNLYKFPTGNPVYDEVVKEFFILEETREYMDDLVGQSESFKVTDYTFDPVNGTFSIFATPGHNISTEELSRLLNQMPPIDQGPKFAMERDKTIYIHPALNGVFVLTETQVDLGKIPLRPREMWNPRWRYLM